MTFEIELVSGLPAADIGERLARAGRFGEICNRALAFYLHELDASRAYHELGHPTAVHFAINRLGLRKRRAHELLAVGRRLCELERLDAAFANGELCWSKVRCVARVATPETEDAWIARAVESSHEDLEAAVKSSRPGDAPRSRDNGLPEPRFVKRFVLDALRHEAFELARRKLSAELGRSVTEDELLDEMVGLLLSSDADGSVPGRKRVDGSMFKIVAQPRDDTTASADPKSRDPKSREPEPEHALVALDAQTLEVIASDAVVKPGMRRRVLERDGHRCRCCGSRRGLMMHHVVFHGEGGPTLDRNLVTLCATCHGLVHKRRLFVSGDGATGFAFRDAANRDVGRRLPTPGIVLHIECATAHCRPDVPASAGAAPMRLSDIPDVVDAKWWREHEHLLRVSRDGRSARFVSTERPMPAAATPTG